MSTTTQPVGFPAVIQGNLMVQWRFIDVIPFNPGGGTLPSTLPGSTIPGSGDFFKGVQSGAKIEYWIYWTVPNDSFYVGDYTAEIVVHAGPGTQFVIPSNPSTWQVIAGPNVVNQPRLQAARDTDQVAVVELWIDNFLVAGTTSTTTTINGVDAFSASFSFDTVTATRILIDDVRAVPDFDGNTTIWNSTSSPGTLTINGTLDGGATAPTTTPILLAKIVITLDGSALTTTSLTLDTLDVTETGSGATIPIAAPVTDSYIRGNTQNNSTVNVFDALFTAQCLVGLRDFGTGTTECHPINAASVRQDSGGNKVSVFDALFIAQYLVGLRDDRFQ